MKIRFLTVAESEAAEAAEYYEAQRTGLGSEFVEELDRTKDRILAHPNAWSPSSRGTRSCQMKRFPYSIIYRVYGNEIVGVALQHHSRDPHRWEDRVFE
jgi:toxin ParE2